MARAAAPMLRGLRVRIMTTRKRSNSAGSPKNAYFTTGNSPAFPAYAEPQRTACPRRQPREAVKRFALPLLLYGNSLHFKPGSKKQFAGADKSAGRVIAME